MIILLDGDTHTGKTFLAQQLLERLCFPYLCLDHLKMGLVRSGLLPDEHRDLSPLSPDADITAVVWPLACEIIKTNIENGQNLIVEGCYFPEDYRASFAGAAAAQYLPHIRYLCLCLSPELITGNFQDIKAFENVVEQRLAPDSLEVQDLLQANAANAARCARLGLACLTLGPGDFASLPERALKLLSLPAGR